MLHLENENSVKTLVTLRLATQVALLGMIDCKIIGICLNISQTKVELLVLSDDRLSDDEREDFDVAATEIMSSLNPIIFVEPRFIENLKSFQVSKSLGFWVFVRRGAKFIE